MSYYKNLKWRNEKLKGKKVNEISIFPIMKPVMKFVMLFMIIGIIFFF